VTELLQHLVNGLSLGTIYALIALGYTMVYGILRMINFAHGEVFATGAFTTFTTSSTWPPDNSKTLVRTASLRRLPAISAPCRDVSGKSAIRQVSPQTET
jgi:branched-subunit amino acid ABC-type transport system permease component